MSDEPRRSGRPTKGQHTHKDLELPQATPAKKRGGAGGKKGTAKKAEPKEEEEIEEEDGADDEIRCICGVTEQDDDKNEDWIACEQCNVWQHNVCMGITTDKNELKKLDYYCEVCKPEMHKDYYEAKERGENIWETRRDEEAARKAKKGKKGKGGRKSLAADNAGTPRSTKSATPAPAVEKKESTRSSKRKNETNLEAQDNKTRKLSSTPTPKVQDAPSAAEDEATDANQPKNGAEQSSKTAAGPKDIASATALLETSRQKPTQMIYKNLLGALSSEKDIDIEATAIEFALRIDEAVENTSLSKEEKVAQRRKLFNNIKLNPELARRLLAKTLSFEQLATMSEQDMASKERQREDEEMRARAEKQSIMISEETGPRIRRTHKGEEIIEDDNGMEDSAQRRAMLDPNHAMGARSRENSPGGGLESDAKAYQYTSEGNDSRRASNHLPPVVTAGSPPQRKESLTADNFDINNIYSKVQTPTAATPGHRASASFLQPPPANNVPDADIDRLLNDVPGGDSPSPGFADNDPSIAWRGSMTMTSIATDFPAVARHIAGGDISKLGSSWGDMLDDRLSVAGRIDPGKAEEYLCSLRYSRITDLCVVELKPDPAGGEQAREQFVALFNHFEQKGKYGVLGSKTSANIRDTYLIPVRAGDDPAPEFLSNLAVNNVPQNRDRPMMLIALVLRHTDYGNDGSSARHLSITNLGPAMSPVTQQGGFPSPAQHNNQYQAPQQYQQQRPGQYGQMYPQQPPMQQPPQGYDPNRPLLIQNQGPPPPGANIPGLNQQYPPPAASQDAYNRGVAMAQRILGEHFKSDVAGFMLAQAAQLTEKEWHIIRAVFDESEEARRDIKVFGALLDRKTNEMQGQNGQNGQVNGGGGDVRMTTEQ